MTYSRRLLLLLLPVLALGCKGTAPTQTGFLSSYSKLEEASPTSLRWVDEDALRGYTTFKIDAVEIYYHEDASHADWDSEQELRKYTHRKMREAIEGAYSVVAAPGPGVARVRIALTDIDKARPLMKVLPVGVVLGTGKGGAAMEAEIVDSRTGEQLVAIVETQEGSRIPLEGMKRLSDAKGIIDGWAERFRERLDAIHGR